MTENEFDLLDRYLDGTINAEEMESLDALLRRSEEARSTLRSLATIDAKWQQLAEKSPVEAAFMERTGDGEDVSVHRFGVDGHGGIRWWLTIGCIAAALLATFGWFHNLGGATEQGIARVIRIEGPGLVNTDRKLSTGGKLLAGEDVQLKQGLIEFSFHETGVHVIATAPLNVRLDSARRIFLHEGEVKLHVPPQGVGFVVETLDRKITDLGTSFVITAREKGSEVLVLDGQIAIADREGGSERLMTEGELASFDQNGVIKLRSTGPSGVPELSLPSMGLQPRSLPGIILGFEDLPSMDRNHPHPDVIGHRVLPLIKSGFQDRGCLQSLKQGAPLRFTGIAGTYNQLPDRTGLTPYARRLGWLAWYQGKVVPPQSGRYRFWGYADNSLLVAVDGEPVFEGSRYDSAFRNQLKVPRGNHPAWPCLNASAGFASGPWVELGEDPVQIDLFFGEISGNATSALLLVEQEGASYEDTFWGQPKWPLFLTEPPDETEKAELAKLREHMEEKLRGSFSISDDAVWKVHHER